MPTRYHSAHSTHPPTPLPVGTPAPNFALPATPDQTVSLADFRGQPVILAFYPADWSPVCEDFLSGARSGVNGTPTFYLNGRRHDASYDLETLLAAIERAG